MKHDLKQDSPLTNIMRSSLTQGSLQFCNYSQEETEWLARSSGGDEVLGGLAPQCSAPPFRQQEGPEAEFGAERQAAKSARSGSPEAPEASAGDQASGSSPKLSVHEQEAWEGNSSCSENSGASLGQGRTKFSAQQLQELERSFQKQHYLGASERRRLSRVLKLSQRQIKTWFQNRRMKFKRQVQEARFQALFSSVSHHCPEMHVPSCLPGLEYNIAFPPSGTVPLYPTLPHPTLLMHSYTSLLPFVSSPPFQNAPGTYYQPTSQGTFLAQDYERVRFHPYFLSS